MVVFVLICIAIIIYAFYKIAEGKEDKNTASQESKKTITGVGGSSSSLSSIQRESIQNAIKQLKESAELVNHTVNPDVFFGRLKFLIETLMYLQKFEGRYNFGSGTPTDDLEAVLNNIEATVSDFISRAYDNCLKSAAKLKTEKGRDNRISRFASEMKNAFEKADSFWPGDTIKPHYGGILFTENNMNEVLQLGSKPVDWSKITEDNTAILTADTENAKDSASQDVSANTKDFTIDLNKS